MPSSYPGALDTFATDKANATAAVDDHPPHHNDLADAVNKVEAELGTNPKGSAATVKARLDAVHDVPVGAEPAAPSSGLLRLYAQFRAQRALLHGKGPSGSGVGFQPAIFQNTVRGIFPSTGGTLTLIGGTLTQTGTNTHPAPTATSFGYCVNVATDATANTGGGFGDSQRHFVRGDGSAGQASGFFMNTRFWIPAAGDLTNSGFIAGMSNTSLANLAAEVNPAASNWVMVQQHDAAGDSRATKFAFVTKGSGTPVVVDTGIAPAINTLYDFSIFSAPYAGSPPDLHMRFEDITNSVVFDHTFPSTEPQLPSDGSILRSFVSCLTTENVAKNIRVKRLYVESDW